MDRMHLTEISDAVALLKYTKTGAEVNKNQPKIKWVWGAFL